MYSRRRAVLFRQFRELIHNLGYELVTEANRIGVRVEACVRPGAGARGKENRLSQIQIRVQPSRSGFQEPLFAQVLIQIPVLRGTWLLVGDCELWALGMTGAWRCYQDNSD